MVAARIREEIQAKVQEAGLEILEARITHLAYASEIAAAMLQRQQASAIIDARGRVTVRGGQFEENTLWGRVRLQQGATIYHKLGLWLPLAAGLLWLGIFWGTRRPSPSTPR